MRSPLTGASAPPRAARSAVSVVFFVNGAIFGSWATRIPDVKAGLGLGDGALGAALLFGGVGGLLGSAASGAAIARWGSRRVAVGAVVACGAVVVLPGVAPSVAALAVAVLLLGAADALLDVAMNAQGVLVERSYGRSILNAFHGAWSLGSVAGGLAGALAAARRIDPALHLAVAGVVLAALVLAVAPRLLPAEADRGVPGTRMARPTGAVGLLGLLTLLAALIEDAPSSWSGVYLREDLGASPGLGGLGFTAWTVGMTVGRLVGDRIVERFGVLTTARSGLLLSAIGLGAGLSLSSPAAAIAGFGLVGLGVAPLFPMAFSAAGNLPGVPAGAAIGMVSLVARIGFLVSPPLIGGSAELTSLRGAFAVVIVAAMAAAALARGLSPVRQGEPPSPAPPGPPPDH